MKCGILGAARIAPAAVIVPAKSHSEFIKYAVAARDKTKAEKYAKQHGIPNVYYGTSGYQGISHFYFTHALIKTIMVLFNRYVEQSGD